MIFSIFSHLKHQVRSKVSKPRIQFLDGLLQGCEVFVVVGKGRGLVVETASRATVDEQTADVEHPNALLSLLLRQTIVH